MNLRSLFLLIPFGAFSAGYFLASRLSKEEAVPAPALVGMPVEHALAAASAHNLNLRVREYIQDSDLPSGTILQQTPRAGQPMKAHQPLLVVLSQRPPWLHAPDLIGKETTIISKELELSGIRVTQIHLPSPYPRNTCFAQYPSPGQHLEKNELLLYISRPAPKTVLWPSVIGKTYASLAPFLETYGITLDARGSRGNESIEAKSLILAQYPAAGSVIIFDPVKPPILQILLK